MPTLELTDEQVLELVKQLPPEQQRAALLALAAGSEERAELRALAQTQLRRLATNRGLDWDEMTEDQREALIDDLVHKDRRGRG
jgi:hypothetical protein